MDMLITRMNQIMKKIRTSSGCGYLYHHFDKLVDTINSHLENTGALNDFEVDKLKQLIEAYAADSIYNTHGSANWMRYSARCFYCADYLSRYIEDKRANENMGHYLNLFFSDLVERGVAPIIQRDVLEKYIKKNADTSFGVGLHTKLIKKAVNECGHCRYWRAGEISLALAYTESMDFVFKNYIEAQADYSILAKCLPGLETVELAKYWYDYPDSANYRLSGRWERETICKCLDKMLDIHLGLISLWYKHSLEELIQSFSSEALIEILEVSEDDEFEKILRHAVTLPFNDKVKAVLDHFVNDDEYHIASLCKQLLIQYQEKKQTCKIYYTLPDFETEESVDLGCNVVAYYSNNCMWLKNTSTGAIRQIRRYDFVYGFNESDYNWDAIGKLVHNRIAYSGELRYGGISRWDDFKDGYCALCWTLYPDGRYFMDDDGFGADDDDEVKVYVILNSDLDIVVPWQPMDVRAELQKLRSKVEQ